MTKIIADFHYITQEINSLSHAQLAELACKSGIQWIQLRVKEKTHEAFLQMAKKTKAICEKYGSRFIVNDNVAIAKEAGADGVHLGKDDMHPLKARQILGEKAIIGATANTIEDIIKLETCHVDYIGLGPFRFTTTKKKLSPVLGLEGFVKIANECQERDIRIPIIAIGGIQKEDVALLMDTGIHGIAVSSAINLAADQAKAAAEFLKTVQENPIRTIKNKHVSFNNNPS